MFKGTLMIVLTNCLVDPFPLDDGVLLEFPFPPFPLDDGVLLDFPLDDGVLLDFTLPPFPLDDGVLLELPLPLEDFFDRIIGEK